MLPKSWVILTFCLIIFATFLQLVGLIAPMWIFVQVSGATVAVGLYFRAGCEADDGGICDDPDFPQDLPFGYTDESTYDDDDWEAVVWMESIGAAVGIVLCIMMFVYLIGFGVWKRMGMLRWAMVIASILAWLTIAIGIIVFCVFHGKVVTRSPEVTSRSFPWSGVFCFVAAILFVIISLLIHFKCRYRTKNAIPASADSKMALNPSSKNQMFRRYFTPSPYREDRRQALFSSAYYNDQSRLLGNGHAAGAIDQADRRGIANQGLRAIEYNTETDSRLQRNGRVATIETNHLSPGITTGSTSNSYNQFRGTVFERDLGAEERTETNGPSVIERTYINRGSNGGQNYTSNNHVERTYTTNTVVQQTPREIAEVRRQQHLQQQEILRTQDLQRELQQQEIQHENEQHRLEDQLRQQQHELDQLKSQQLRQEQLFRQSQREAESRNIEERRIILGQEKILDRHGHDVFDGGEVDNTDAETIYYTGKDNIPYTTGFHQHTATNNASNNVMETLTREYQTVISTAQIPRPPPPPPAVQEEIVREVTVIEQNGAPPGHKRHFRVAADQEVSEGIKTAEHYTVHTRPRHDAMEGAALAQGHLSGDKFKYNKSFIYRPYSEEAY